MLTAALRPGGNGHSRRVRHGASRRNAAVARSSGSRRDACSTSAAASAE